MKYIRIRFANSSHITFDIGCSECGTEVHESDNFCKQCGHKLNFINDQLKIQDVMTLINMHKDELNKEENINNENV